jgi:hypothetical protein
MIYPIELMVPANTLQNAMVSARHFLPPGKIVRIGWVMPTGCNNMVKARLLMNETQILPILPDTWLKGNGVMGWFDEDITIPEGGTHLQLVSCSPDTTYQHVITLYIDLVQSGATVEDLIEAVRSLAAIPAATEEEILSEGESKASNIFTE